MADTTAKLHVCPICSSDLAHDGICLVCAFSDALETVSDVPATSTFSHQPETSRQPQYRPFGKPSLPCDFAEHRLLREIASGGMGVVYEAENRKLKRIVALKMIRSAAEASVEARARFRAEAEAAAKLEHESIVPIYEIGECEGLPYFTMRLIEGGSLAQRLATSSSPMSEKEAAVFMSRCARAVQYAHEHGVLHRDLTPANILLDGQGQPWISDFGVAKRLDSELALTQTSAQLGTPHYMSPEQAAGQSKHITTASDVWSLGVLLYQLVSQRLPFDGGNNLEIMQKVVNAEPVSLRTNHSLPHGGGVSTDLRTIIARCLEKNPSHRIHTAGFLADELDRLVAGIPIHSRPVSTWVQLKKWAIRHPAVAVLLILCATLIVSGTAAVFDQWNKAIVARDAAVKAQQTTSEVLYFSSVANLVATVQAGQTGDARRLLKSLIPVDGEPDLRGPEWYILRQLCDGKDIRKPDGSRLISNKQVHPGGIGWLNTSEYFAVGQMDGSLAVWGPYQGGLVARAKHPAIAAPASVLTSGTKVRLLYSPTDQRVLWNHASIVQCVDNKTEKLLFREELNKPDVGWLDDSTFYLSRRLEEKDKDGPAAWIVNAELGTKQELPIGIGSPLYLSPDRKLLIGSTLKGPVRIWMNGAWESGGSFQELNKQGRPNFIAVSPDQRMLAISSFSASDSLNHLFVYQLPTGDLLYRESGFSPIVGLQFHPTMPYLAIAGDRPEWHYLHLTGEPRQRPSLITMTGHNDGLRHLSLSPQGKYAITLGAGNQLLLWHHPESTPLNSSSFISASVKGRTPLFGPSEDIFIVSATTGPRVHGYGSSHHVERQLTNHQAFAWSPQGQLYTWLEEAKTLHCVNYSVSDATAQTVWSIKDDHLPLDGMLIDGALTPSAEQVVLCTSRSLSVIDTQARTSRTVAVRGGSGRTGHNAFAMAPSGSHLALVGFSLHPQVHSLDQLDQSVQLQHDGLQDISIAFCPSHQWLLAGNEDGEVRAWGQSTWSSPKPETTTPLHRWPTHIGPVTGLAASPDGRYLVTSGDTQLKLWEIKDSSLHLRASFPVPSPRHWIRFSPDGRWLHHAGIGTPAERWALRD
jgi:WD40 repeat protein/predicted Ser/Thr protein kinase